MPIVLLLALVVRLWQLTAHPYVINGIEAQLGLEALAVNRAFGVAWLTNPTLPLFLDKGLLALFGRTPLALRILSPIIGTLSVFAIYHAGRLLWSRQLGLLAALLLAFSHTHIHYSRLGMSNVWDPLLAVAALACAAAAWHGGRRRDWLLAGAASGLSAYFYTAAHLLPLMLATLLLLALIIDGAGVRRRLPGLAAAALLALLISLPQLRVYIAQPELFMEHATVLGIVQSGWLEAAAAARNETQATIFGRQLWQAATGFDASIDLDGSFNPAPSARQRYCRRAVHARQRPGDFSPASGALRRADRRRRHHRAIWRRAVARSAAQSPSANRAAARTAAGGTHRQLARRQTRQRLDCPAAAWRAADAGRTRGTARRQLLFRAVSSRSPLC